MCGEMAGDAMFTKLLLGMGLEEFSMHPNALAEVKHIILNSAIEELQPIIDSLLTCTSHDKYQALLDKLSLH